MFETVKTWQKTLELTETMGEKVLAGSALFHLCEEKQMSRVDNVVSPRSDRQQSVDLLQLFEAHFYCIIYWSQCGSQVNLTPLVIICESNIIASHCIWYHLLWHSACRVTQLITARLLAVNTANICVLTK